MALDKIPKSLRHWFFIHFLVDYIIAIPLFVFPHQTLSVFDWEIIDPVAARLTGAALLAIGGTSLLVRNRGIDTYRTMLILKLLWSGSAIIGIVISLREGVSLSVLIFLLVFALFFIIWSYYLKQIESIF